jgi:hypothetical protein
VTFSDHAIEGWTTICGLRSDVSERMAGTGQELD